MKKKTLILMRDTFFASFRVLIQMSHSEKPMGSGRFLLIAIFTWTKKGTVGTLVFVQYVPRSCQCAEISSWDRRVIDSARYLLAIGGVLCCTWPSPDSLSPKMPVLSAKKKKKKNKVKKISFQRHFTTGVATPRTAHIGRCRPHAICFFL